MLYANQHLRTLALITALCSSPALGEDSGGENRAEAADLCLLQGLKQADPQTTVAEIRADCAQSLTSEAITSTTAGEKNGELGPLAAREVGGNAASNSPYLLSGHRANYILPFSYIENTNSQIFADSAEVGNLDNTEVHFQISLKAQVTDSILFSDDSLWVAYSMRAFWQAYNGEISRPFRETNHEPELIWQTHSELSWLGFDNVYNEIALNHQSNGRSGDLSRSWNRLIFSSAWERKKMSLVATYWERLHRDSSLDENPRIETYVGNAQLLASYAFGDKHRATLMLRGNPEEGKGAAELTWSFPLPGTQKIRGMARYFDGYGDSLLDYNVRTRSFGLGFIVTDWY